MKSRHARVGAALMVAMVVGLAIGAFAQQATGKRDFDAEYRAAVQSAKNASEFEFLGALARTCLLPQTGGENTNDNVPNYVANPASASAPRCDTHQVSIRPVEAWAIMTSTFGQARTSSVGMIGPCNNRQVRGFIGAEAGAGAG